MDASTRTSEGAAKTSSAVDTAETSLKRDVRLETEGQEPAAPFSEMCRRCARRPGRGLILGSPDGAPRGFVGRGRRRCRARRVLRVDRLQVPQQVQRFQ
ncbi:unnamed protein product [Ascophyllum nodosum]